MSLLPRIDGYLHAAPRVMCDAVPVGPFTVYLNRETDSPYISYARPSEPLRGDLGAEIEAVRALFRQRGRVARWEWIHDLYPELEPALEACGVRTEVTPLMTVTPERFRFEPGEGIEIRRVGAEEDFGPMIRAQRLAFGMEDVEPSESERATVRAWLGRGGCFFQAVVDGTVAGGGGYLPIAGVAEVAGIGTRPEFQRRGVGGAITAALVRDAFARGCDCVFLTAGDERAVRVYRRVGFEVAARGMGATESEEST